MLGIADYGSFVAAVIVFLMFFPLFVDPARHRGLATFTAMAVTIALLTFCYGLVVVLLTHRLAARLSARPAIGQTLNRIAGVFLIGFAVKLALSRRGRGLRPPASARP